MTERYKEIGTQNDGEPAVVAEVTEPVVTEEVAVEPVVEPKDEKLEEPSGEEHKPRVPGSKRAKEALLAEREKTRQLEERLHALEAKANPPTVDAEPQEDDFETYREYTKALARFEARQELAEATKKAREESEQAKAQVEESERFQKLNDKILTCREKFKDFDGLVEDYVDQFGAPPPHIQQLLASDRTPAEVLHYLVSNPDKHNELNRLSATDAAFELAEIKAKLATPEKPKPKTTNAPAPIAPLTGRSGAIPAKSRMDTYQEIR